MYSMIHFIDIISFIDVNVDTVDLLPILLSACRVYCFVGGILAGYISDKKECSGITVVVMLIIAAPMVSASTLVYSKELGVARVGGCYSIWNSCGKCDLSCSKIMITRTTTWNLPGPSEAVIYLKSAIYP